ncbi:hypothetical protein FH972_024039 [Carpinus fangiana]|uniref:NADH:ubiquinone oxidoreductase intermediate-associated protein 30 domain-containing protein n=1 Tax=Carpinus fangiana TaxID=176857 RepID=A0A5N6KX69_9ROSI|nr:hypothetical protein FH972_024039 [Carpinus fangiana]
MKHTPSALAVGGFPGFWKRSLDHFKNQTNVALKLETLERVKNSLTLWDFSSRASVESCADMSDHDIGGQSTGLLEFVPATNSDPAHARFSGHISNELPEDDDNGRVQRTGYAAWRTEPRPPTIFGRQLWDVDSYNYLALRIKADARKYKVNVQTESIEFTDLHQHRLYARRQGQWETVLIKWADFVRTNHGIIVEPQSEMVRTQVRTIGIGLTDRLPGPFDICVSRMWATNGLTEDEQQAAGHAELPRMKMPLGAVPKRLEASDKKP